MAEALPAHLAVAACFLLEGLLEVPGDEVVLLCETLSTSRLRTTTSEPAIYSQSQRQAHLFSEAYAKCAIQ